MRIAKVGGFSSLLLFSTQVPVAAAEQVEVAVELERLAETYGFAVIGLEQTTESFGRADGGEVYLRLRHLLENFDHVIVQSPTGGVDRVIVLGEKIPADPPPAKPLLVVEGADIVMETERRGAQHLMRVLLGGKDGSKVERMLQVDTGADYLVLPLSLVEELGIDKKSLQAREMQTANGMVEARIGTLPSLWMGEHRVRDVETAFLEDAKLGGNALLGMSVLGRYKLTINDDKNSVVLGSKE